MSYKVGNVIGKYTVTRDFDSANAGQCQWGFAKYDGQEYFIKKFLNPVYPKDKAPGSEKSKQNRRDLCDQFAIKQLAIMNALSACGSGGLVVKTVDFFRHGNDIGEFYFKISEKVNTSSLSGKVHTLEQKKRLLVMLTAAGALNILHKNGIIHLDLKPDNILIQEYEGRLISKIIDFDSSILEGEKVPPDSLVGDAVYYSPEFARHIATNGETPPPNKKSDTFSLGLIFHQYWFGTMPNFSPKYSYAHTALLNGENLKIFVPPPKDESKLKPTKGTLIINFKSSSLPKIDTDPTETAIKNLIAQMLVLDPEKRLSITEVHQKLRKIYNPGTVLETEPVLPRPSLIFSKNLKR
jgi:eukaryotic-like serine/threonine-protein kinase